LRIGPSIGDVCPLSTGAVVSGSNVGLDPSECGDEAGEAAREWSVEWAYGW
jgi:hypothetical protein